MYYCDPIQNKKFKAGNMLYHTDICYAAFHCYYECKNSLRLSSTQMYGRYTQELGVFAKEEAARLRDGGVRDGGGVRRNASVRSRADLLEYEKDPCAKCQCK